MMRLNKPLLMLSLGLLVAGHARAFSLLGTNKTWQVSALGYDRPGDIGGPMGLTEDYRWNITNIFYAMDASFLNYFGTRGMAEVDKAYAILNALTNASAMSHDLREFPQTGMLRQNFRAAALNILDLKSRVLEMMMEQVGLAESIRWTWSLRARNTETIGNTTITNYTVVKLNYDPVDWTPSDRVNGSLFGYDIVDPIPPDDYADAIERSLDTIPFANGDPSPVSSAFSGTGQYWQGLTRDDVGGIRFLLRTNNYNTERILPGSLVAITNRADTAQVITNIDLGKFLRDTRQTTNDPTTLLSLYTNLVLTSTSSTPVLELATNVLFYFSNAPLAGPITDSQFIATNRNTNILTIYDYTVDNLLTNQSRVKMLVGGAFTNFAVATRTNLLRLNANGSLDLDFAPWINGAVQALAVLADGRVIVGGAFTQVNGVDIPHLARLNRDGSLDITFLPLVNGPVRALALQPDGQVLAAGEFDLVNGLPHAGLARVQPDGLVDPSFLAEITGRVDAVALQANGQIVIGGSFSAVNGAARTNVARLNSDGTLDGDFAAAVNDAVAAMVVQEDGQILLGGAFSSVNGQARNHIARLNPDGSLETAFQAWASADVLALHLQADDRIIMGGEFVNVNGSLRSRLARLNPDGSLDPTFVTTASGPVRSLGRHWDGQLLVGGQLIITNAQSEAYTNFARLNPDGSLDASLDRTAIGGAGDDVLVTAGQGFGDVYLVPPALFGYEFVNNLFTNVVAVTNLATTDLGYFVDTNSPIPLSTTNLAEFNAIAATNSPGDLQTIFPDLVVTSSYYVLTNQTLTNFLFTLTNPPFAPAGFLMPVFHEVVTNVLATNYFHTFGNVITNTLYPVSPVNHQRIEVFPEPFAPAGSGLLRTNVVDDLIQSNYVNGSIYIVPTNFVGYQLISTLLTNYTAITNIIQPAFLGTNTFGTNVVSTNVVSTNLTITFTNEQLVAYGTNYTFSVFPVQRFTGFSTNVTGTNVFGTTNPIVVSYLTNVVSAVFPVEFQSATNSVNIRPGVDRLHFINVTRNYDSLIGQFFTPITNQYVENVITNSQLRSQVVRRVLGAPDILFLAQDLGLVNNLVPVVSTRSGTGGWENNDAINGQAPQFGPGVIRPPIFLRFSDQLPYFLNSTPFFLDESTAFGGFVWGSYDGTTNAPVVYPDFLSIRDLEDQVLHPPSLP